MLALLAALVLLLPSASDRHYGEAEALSSDKIAVRINGQVIHELWTGQTYQITANGGAKLLKRSRLPCPYYLVSFIGERFLAARTNMNYGVPPTLSDYSLWYLFPPDTGWVPVTWLPPCYLVPDWEAWRADQERVDEELMDLRKARDEYRLWWQEH